MEKNNKKSKSSFFPTTKYNQDLRAHKIKRITTVKRDITVSCSIKQEFFFLSIESPSDIERLLYKFELGCSDKVHSCKCLLCHFSKPHLKNYPTYYSHLPWDTTDSTSC